MAAINQRRFQQQGLSNCQQHSNSYNSNNNQYQQTQQPRTVSQSAVPMQFQHHHSLHHTQQQQQTPDESPMGSFGLSAAAPAVVAPPAKQGWRARQQEQQEQQALQQQQQMVQYEMMKLQMYQQAQYFAQAQAQMALLSINNSQVNAAGHVVQVVPSVVPGQKTSTVGRASPVQLDEPAAKATQSAQQGTAARTLSANASAFKPSARTYSSESSNPSSPTSEHNLPITPEQDLPQFIGNDTALYLGEKQQVSVASAVSFPIRQPLGPPVAEVKDLGQLNFLCRNRRQISGRLGGLMELAMGRQAILAH